MQKGFANPNNITVSTPVGINGTGSLVIERSEVQTARLIELIALALCPEWALAYISQID